MRQRLALSRIRTSPSCSQLIAHWNGLLSELTSIRCVHGEKDCRFPSYISPYWLDHLHPKSEAPMGHRWNDLQWSTNHSMAHSAIPDHMPEWFYRVKKDANFDLERERKGKEVELVRIVRTSAQSIARALIKWWLVWEWLLELAR